MLKTVATLCAWMIAIVYATVGVFDCYRRPLPKLVAALIDVAGIAALLYLLLEC